MSQDFAAARLNMVESQMRVSDVTDLPLQDALRVVARETCVPVDKAHLAYAETPVEYAPGRWLLSPRDVAKLLQAVRPRAGERALAIAAPYAAAVMEAMGLTVERLDGDDLSTVPGANYDLVICEGAVAACPAAWTAALAPNGRLGVIERQGPVGRAALYRRADDGVGKSPLFDATPPVLAGFELRPSFAF
jgi:protein-L-isoaspartate(D-aspartate) O-methyltransferase